MRKAAPTSMTASARAVARSVRSTPCDEFEVCRLQNDERTGVKAHLSPGVFVRCSCQVWSHDDSATSRRPPLLATLGANGLACDPADGVALTTPQWWSPANSPSVSVSPALSPSSVVATVVRSRVTNTFENARPTAVASTCSHVVRKEAVSLW